MFYFVRHGKTDYSERNTKIYQGFGVNLSKLSETGVHQIKETAKDERLQGADIILSSPYTRALQTASILSKELGVDIVIETDLYEWLANKNFIYEDDTTAENAYREYERNQGEYPANEEKLWEDAKSIRERVLKVLRKYSNYERVIVACHGMMIQAVTGEKHPECGEIVEFEDNNMGEYKYCTLREIPELKDAAAEWFHSKWGVPKEAYLECMAAYLNNKTELGWYLCLEDGKIIGGMGVIENDFHDRKDLTPNVCAVYTEKEYRCKGIAGHLLDMVVDDMKSKGITPVYLVTDHTGFYERYGWEFLCMVQGDNEPDMTRMYIHR